MRQSILQCSRILWLLSLLAIPFIVHAALLSGRWTMIAATLLGVSLFIAGVRILTHVALPYKRAFIAILAGVLFFAFWKPTQYNLIIASAIPYIIVYIILLIVFIRSLLPGRTPIITILARRVRGPLTDELALYTYRVTWMWCGFFAAQLASGLFFYLYAPIAVWSFFVNVLNFPLILLMFGIEYSYRSIRFRHYPRESLSDMLRAFKPIRSADGKN